MLDYLSQGLCLSAQNRKLLLDWTYRCVGSMATPTTVLVTDVLCVLCTGGAGFSFSEASNGLLQIQEWWVLLLLHTYTHRRTHVTFHSLQQLSCACNGLKRTLKCSSPRIAPTVGDSHLWLVTLWTTNIQNKREI